jgi:hypothetical protein
MNPIISLTDFIDFSIKTGPSRRVKVKEIKQRNDYHPGTDYWKKMRDGLADLHKNSYSIDFLDNLVDKTNENKKNNYSLVASRYKNFLGKSSIEWFDPHKEVWAFNNLGIRVNPELGLIINGVPHIIKIYFKEDVRKPETKLNKRRLESIFYLMEDRIKPFLSDDVELSILNAKTGKLITHTKPSPGIKEVLESDALAFMHLWNTI